jgi:phage/plasmid primase-like uncharacterized protein
MNRHHNQDEFVALDVGQFEQLFSDELCRQGFGDHHIRADGEWHDFMFPDSKKKKPGAAKLTFGGDGVVIDRRNPDGNSPIFVWRPENTVELTDAERKDLARQNALRAAELKVRQDAARLKAIKVFEAEKPATPDHPYLQRKGITDPRPLRLGSKRLGGGELTIPIYNASTGLLQSLQTISTAGHKRFLGDGVTTGGCVMPGSTGLDDLDTNSDPIVIAEGFATAEAIHRATNLPTLAALNCGNMKPVAELMRKRFRKRKIILAADHDAHRHNPGLAAANNAAAAVNGKVAVPPKVGNDFSDLLLAEGPEVVATIIREAITKSRGDNDEAAADTDKAPDGDTAADDKHPRPTIQVLAHEGPTVAKRAEEILLNNGAEMYQRSGLLVRHVVEEADASHGRKTKVARLVEITPVYLRNELGKVIRWERYDKREKKYFPSAVPPDVAPVILSQVGHWTFHTIAGVITTPTMRPDGSLLLTAGYDEATRLLLVAPPVMPTIPDTPTRDDALVALALLQDLLTEFPFDDDDKTKDGRKVCGKGISRAVALSGLISPVVRGAFPVVPLHVSRAPIASSGKSYLWDVGATIAIGRLMPVMAAGRTEEETEKRLGAALMAGQPLISIDNVNGELGGDALCQVIERPIVNIRVLCKSEQVSIEARSTSIFCTGNNIALVGDLVRRAIVASLDPELEQPELKVFDKDPVAMVLEDRGKYIAACLTICRAYLVAGRPNKAGRLASFEGWSDTVRSALIWLGTADPVASIETARAEDPERNQLSDLLTAWADTIGLRNEQTIAQVIKQSEELDSFSNFQYPELRSALQAAAGKKSGPPGPRGQAEAVSLGQWLRGRKGRILGGLRFASKATRGHAARWWVEHKDGLEAEDKYRKEQEEEAQTTTSSKPLTNDDDEEVPF